MEAFTLDEAKTKLDHRRLSTPLQHIYKTLKVSLCVLFPTFFIGTFGCKK